jgi:predicted patatin/cPLA2 family phospholipase
MANRHNMYNEQTRYIFEKADRGEVLVICPDKPLGISRTEKNPDELERVYQEGRKAGESFLPEVKKFLGC